jgi:hypothetical protein
MDPSLIARPTSFERASAALHRVLWIAASVLRGLAILALVAAVSVPLGGLACLIVVPPHDGLNGAPAFSSSRRSAPAPLLFVAGLRDLQRLPERTRLPADVSARVRDLRDRARKVSQPKGVLGAIVGLLLLGRAVLTSRDALSPFGVVAIVLRPAMLLAALFAALAAVLEIPAALVFLVILAVTWADPLEAATIEERGPVGRHPEASVCTSSPPPLRLE